ncbi:diguanylate cyclase [Luteibacter jiangsuensis]|uniref:diguanylate cyclase n=1 Tax=Luteibacter jiangsuensis TaxID=637577 RepID=A0ABT9SXI2_9GAMM|nr:GGDEF domain-containing protein [Luteibacter jiangsuensis]MDQ0009707.1 diguanylate cyclase [Luteibacter jiangsuensis]
MRLDNQLWESKYHEAVERLTREEAQWRTAESLLRQLVGCLGRVAHGAHDQVDPHIERLSAALSGTMEPLALEPLVTELAEAIEGLGARPRGVNDERSIPITRPQRTEHGSSVQSSLSRLVDRIVILPRLADRANDLRHDVADAGDLVALAACGDRLADLVNEQRIGLQREIDALQAVLRHVTGRLDEMSQYMSRELADQSTGEANGQALDASVAHEMRLLGEAALEIDDMHELRERVNQSLETISLCFRDFRDREGIRLTAYRERAERMRLRIEQLETERNTLQRSLEREHELAQTDTMIGMPNRLAYEKRIEAAYESWQATMRPLSVAAIDIDHFKSINDTYGHTAGDAVLRIIGQALLKHIRPCDFVARYGGEEFIVIFDGADEAESLQVCERLRGKIQHLAFHASRQPVRVTASIGLTQFRPGDTPQSVFDRADLALYTAKNGGRNRCAVG